MHKQEFIFREIQEKLGNTCQYDIAEMVFKFALKREYVDSDWEGDWYWTAKAYEAFINDDNFIKKLYGAAVKDLCEENE